MRIHNTHQALKVILLYRYLLTLAYFYQNMQQEEPGVNEKTVSGVSKPETGIISSDFVTAKPYCIKENGNSSVELASDTGMNMNPQNYVDPMGETTLGPTNTYSASLYAYPTENRDKIKAYEKARAKAKKRAFGGLQAVGGALMVKAGGALCATGGGAPLGAALIAVGADNLVAGAKTMTSGEDTETLGHQALRGGASLITDDPAAQHKIADYGEMSYNAFLGGKMWQHSIKSSGVKTGAAKVQNSKVATADDYISEHAYKRHKFDPSRISTRSRTQYGQRVDPELIKEQTLELADEIVKKYDLEGNHYSTIYKKRFNYNISTPATPTRESRVIINHGDSSRSSQFPFYRQGVTDAF